MATRKSAGTVSRSFETGREKSRFIYHGHAVGAAGRIVRVDSHCGLNEILPVQAASSLPVIGGVSRSIVDRPCPLDYLERPIFRLACAQSLAETPASEWTTRVSAEADALEVLGNAITVDHISAELTTRHQPGDPYPHIQMGDCRIDGLRIGGVLVTVEIDDTFRSACTMEELETLAARIDWRPGHPPKRVAESHIIKKVTFGRGGKPKGVKYNPHRRLRNRIVLEDVGTIFLGEMLVTDYSRRLTMLRIALGSPVQGDFAAGEVESDGHIMP